MEKFTEKYWDSLIGKNFSIVIGTKIKCAKDIHPLQAGDEFEVLSLENGWYKILFNGHEELLSAYKLERGLIVEKLKIVEGDIEIEEIIIKTDLIIVTQFLNKIRISFPYNPAMVEDVKKISKRSWDSEAKKWICPIEVESEVMSFVEKWAGRNPKKEKYQEISKMHGNPSDGPIFPTTWNHLKKEGAWILGENLNKAYLGQLTDFTSSKKNATIKYNESPDDFEIGTIIVTAQGSHKNFYHSFYRRDQAGWVYLGDNII